MNEQLARLEHVIAAWPPARYPRAMRDDMRRLHSAVEGAMPGRELEVRLGRKRR